MDVNRTRRKVASSHREGMREIKKDRNNERKKDERKRKRNGKGEGGKGNGEGQ